MAQIKFGDTFYFQRELGGTWSLYRIGTMKALISSKLKDNDIKHLTRRLVEYFTKEIAP